MKKRWFCILAALLALCLLAQVGAIAEGEGARKNGAAVKYNVFDKIKVTHVRKPIPVTVR